MSDGNNKTPTIETPSSEETAQYGGGAQGEAAPMNEVDRLRGEVKDLKEKWLRAQAEVQNVTRRLADEKATAVRFAVADFAKSVLPVVDNFERTMASLQEHHHDDVVIQGVKLVYEMLRKTLAEHQVTPIEALGKPFDPTRHDALRRVETNEQAEGTVVEEYEKGYMLRDRVLRAAKVALAAKPGA